MNGKQMLNSSIMNGFAMLKRSVIDKEIMVQYKQLKQPFLF